MKLFFRNFYEGFFRDLINQIQKAQIPLTAASLAYTTILSVIPLMAVSFAIFHAFGGMGKLYETVEPYVISNLAEGAGEEVLAKIHEFVGNAHASAVGVGGLIGLLFTSLSMLSSAENAIHRVWGSPGTRTLFQKISAYWLIVTLGPLAGAIAVGVATSKDVPIVNLLPGGAGLFFLSVGLFYLVYKYVPYRRVDAICALISAAVAATGFQIAQAAFRLYTRKVVTYSKVYGSLGAVPILLIWIDLVWIIVLSGAAVTAVLQKRRMPAPRTPADAAPAVPQQSQ